MHRFFCHTALALLFITLCSSAPAASAAFPHRGQLVVDDDKAECPNAAFTHIQKAIDAASPGDVIRICKGIYAEQITIRKPLRIEADSGAIVMPSAMQANATSLFDAAPIAAAVLVAGATDVAIFGLTVDGSNNAIAQCAPDLIGIAFQNASGHSNTSQSEISNSPLRRVHAKAARAFLFKVGMAESPR